MSGALLLLLAALVGGPRAPQAAAPADEAAPRLAIRCGKLLTMDADDRIFAPGLVLVRDGRIEYAGPPKDVPAGYEELDVGGREAWVHPGMVDLHTHVHSGGGDINDMVYPANPELRVSPTVRPSNRYLKVACASGVTTLFGIPGSGTSISGFGVLYKTETDAGYEDVVLADPGGMKVAQTHNPERGPDLGRTRAGLSWILEKVNDRALAAERLGRRDPRLADLAKVLTGELPVLIHCAGADGVASTARMWRKEYPEARSVLSHGSFHGHYAAEYVASLGMPVNNGPRTMNWSSGRREERIQGLAQAYVDAGVPLFSLNTDSGVIPQEMLFLQGAMSARLGADPYLMLRALTIHPAMAFGIDDRVGSLEPGKDADVVIRDGDPLDPRSRVELVLIDGRVQYDRRTDGQWF